MISPTWSMQISACGSSHGECTSGALQQPRHMAQSHSSQIHTYHSPFGCGEARDGFKHVPHLASAPKSQHHGSTKVTAPWFASPDLAQCTTTLRRFALFLKLARMLCICSALRLWIFGLAEIGFSNSLGAFPLRSSRGGGIAPPLQHFDCGDRTKRRRPPSSTRDLI